MVSVKMVRTESKPEWDIENQIEDATEDEDGGSPEEETSDQEVEEKNEDLPRRPPIERSLNTNCCGLIVLIIIALALFGILAMVIVNYVNHPADESKGTFVQNNNIIYPQGKGSG